MKNNNFSFIIFLAVLFLYPPSGNSQESSSSNKVPYELNKVNPAISVSKDQLIQANHLKDLNKHYKPSWVKEYISVAIFTNHKGVIKKAVAKNHLLSSQQKENILTADQEKEISVKVQYIPDNNLADTEVKEINFTFSIDPDKDAAYIGGIDQMNQYLYKTAINRIPSGSFINYDLTAVKFTVDENGEIIDTFLFQPSKNKEVDELLLKTINAMPNWIPASYSNGITIKQDFVLTVGNMENCIVNILNIR